MHFLLEIYEAIRKSVGDDYLVLLKLTASEFFDGGLSFEETRVICKKMEQAGVDGIELSGNVHGKANSLAGKSFDGYTIQNEGYFASYGKVVSKEVSIPIITVGGLSDLNTIEQILKTTDIQFFAMARPLLAEPSLIKRWKAEDRRPVQCLRCSKCRTPDGNYCTIFNKKGGTLKKEH